MPANSEPSEQFDPQRFSAPHEQIEELTIARAQERMAAGDLTARQLTMMYLERIAAMNEAGPALRAVIETNPQALEIAETLDRERAASGPRGPLHGIPVLLKDNIDTADQMQTTAGSLALADSRPASDAFVAVRLRAAGAVLLGKANMSEWANFRSSQSSSGWSARGGQARNPYALERSPSGSSSGSATAVAANLALVALGTETNGSIISPAAANGVVGIKPTVGLTSRAGVIPIAHSQDSVGPFGRTVADAAATLGALTGIDPRDDATQASAGRGFTDYTQFLDADALRGARIGVARETFFGYSEKSDPLAEAAIAILRSCGAEVIDPANIPTATALRDTPAEIEVLLYECHHDLDAYLATRDGAVRSLEQLIAFNDAHAAAEMPFFGQDRLTAAAAKGPLTEEAYLRALAEIRRLARGEGIDAALQAHRLDALFTLTGGPAWKIDLLNGDPSGGGGGSSGPAALAGYPIITVPLGMVAGLPIGASFTGTAFSEPKLIALAYAFEQATLARTRPTYAPAIL
ncbi:MAG TPA: amidase [Ktedonobacterales bacterium]|nr:amidase [Ktedonobacterales bacterium]